MQARDQARTLCVEIVVEDPDALDGLKSYLRERGLAVIAGAPAEWRARPEVALGSEVLVTVRPPYPTRTAAAEGRRLLALYPVWGWTILHAIQEQLSTSE